MNSKSLFASTIALTLLGAAILPQIAKADIPMDVSCDEGYCFLTVPHSDTTVSAYGGRLRHYDVHIAKMFEMTRFYCAQKNDSEITKWQYSAESGKAKMGEFHISCPLARDIATAYGLGKTERTKTFRGYTDVPTLNITGGKVEKWMRFTSNFKPVR
jgi:hypothetical protein